MLSGDALFVVADTTEIATIDVTSKSLVIVGDRSTVVSGSNGATMHLHCPASTPCSIDVHGLQLESAAAQDVLLIDQATTTATFTGTTFGPSGKFGVELKSGSLTLEGCNVNDNAQGGLNFAAGGTYVVESTIVVGNGTTSSNFGGADLKNLTSRNRRGTRTGRRLGHALISFSTLDRLVASLRRARTLKSALA